MTLADEIAQVMVEEVGRRKAGALANRLSHLHEHLEFRKLMLDVQDRLMKEADDEQT